MVELIFDAKAQLNAKDKWLKGLISFEYVEDLYPVVLFNWLEQLLQSLKAPQRSTWGYLTSLFSSPQQQDPATEILLFEVIGHLSPTFNMKVLMIASAFPVRLNLPCIQKFFRNSGDAAKRGHILCIDLDDKAGENRAKKFGVVSQGGDDYEEKKHLIFDKELSVFSLYPIYRSPEMTIERLQRMIDSNGEERYNYPEILASWLAKIYQQNEPFTVQESETYFKTWMDNLERVVH